MYYIVYTQHAGLHLHLKFKIRNEFLFSIYICLDLKNYLIYLCIPKEIPIQMYYFIIYK